MIGQSARATEMQGSRAWPRRGDAAPSMRARGGTGYSCAAAPSASQRVICATWRPWKRAMVSSLSEGWRLPSPFAIVLAP